jgi:tetratricopeptide (TPR) repeat protein
MMVRWLFICAGIGLATSAFAADDDAKTYADCMNAARSRPDDGFEAGSVWRDHGGGFPAEHCIAIAMIGLKQYPEAAHRLEALAQEMVKESADLRGEILSQAAEAWSLAGRPQNAVPDLTEAIRLVPQSVDFVVNRAAARAEEKDYAGAIEDLNALVRRGIDRADIFAYRAASYRLLGDLKDAAADAGHAVEIGATLPEAWLERANVRRLSGDKAGARQDWLQVIRLAPQSPAADSARENLETLDVHVEASPDDK